MTEKSPESEWNYCRPCVRIMEPRVPSSNVVGIICPLQVPGLNRVNWSAKIRWCQAVRPKKTAGARHPRHPCQHKPWLVHENTHLKWIPPNCGLVYQFYDGKLVCTSVHMYTSLLWQKNALIRKLNYLHCYDSVLFFFQSYTSQVV